MVSEQTTGETCWDSSPSSVCWVTPSLLKRVRALELNLVDHHEPTQRKEGRAELIIASVLLVHQSLKASRKETEAKTFPYLKLESLEIKFGPSGISRLLWRISFSYTM